MDPDELKKQYGSVLPPSLRLGATGQASTSTRQPVVGITRSQTAPDLSRSESVKEETARAAQNRLGRETDNVDPSANPRRKWSGIVPSRPNKETTRGDDDREELVRRAANQLTSVKVEHDNVNRAAALTWRAKTARARSKRRRQSSAHHLSEDVSSHPARDEPYSRDIAHEPDKLAGAQGGPEPPTPPSPPPPSKADSRGRQRDHALQLQEPEEGAVDEWASFFKKLKDEKEAKRSNRPSQEELEEWSSFAEGVKNTTQMKKSRRAKKAAMHGTGGPRKFKSKHATTEVEPEKRPLKHSYAESEPEELDEKMSASPSISKTPLRESVSSDRSRKSRNATDRGVSRAHSRYYEDGDYMPWRSTWSTEGQPPDDTEFHAYSRLDEGYPAYRSRESRTHSNRRLRPQFNLSANPPYHDGRGVDANAFPESGLYIPPRPPPRGIYTSPFPPRRGPPIPEPPPRRDSYAAEALPPRDPYVPEPPLRQDFYAAEALPPRGPPIPEPRPRRDFYAAEALPPRGPPIPEPPPRRNSYAAEALPPRDYAPYTPLTPPLPDSWYDIDHAHNGRSRVRGRSPSPRGPPHPGSYPWPSSDGDLRERPRLDLDDVPYASRILINNEPLQSLPWRSTVRAHWRNAKRYHGLVDGGVDHESVESSHASNASFADYSSSDGVKVTYESSSESDHSQPVEKQLPVGFDRGQTRGFETSAEDALPCWHRTHRTKLWDDIIGDPATREAKGNAQQHETKRDTRVLDAGLSDSRSAFRAVASSRFVGAQEGKKGSLARFSFLNSTSPQGDLILFYAKHFPQEQLDVEKFKKSVLSLPELRCYGDELVKYLTTEWKSDNEWSTQAGHLGRSPQPHLTSTLRVVPICLPYVYDAAKRERRETSSIAQTLFQYLNLQGDARRDQKQVRSQRDAFGPNKQLYTSQLWALLIDDKYLISCATASEDEIYGELWEPLVHSAPVNGFDRSLDRIRLSTPDARYWLFEKSECKTFMDFVAHFSDVTIDFHGKFEVFMNERAVLPHQWPAVVQKTGNSIHLSLKVRSRESTPVCPEDYLLGVYPEHPYNTPLQQNRHLQLLDLRSLRAPNPDTIKQSSQPPIPNPKVQKALLKSLHESRRLLESTCRQATAHIDPSAWKKATLAAGLPDFPVQLSGKGSQILADDIRFSYEELRKRMKPNDHILYSHTGKLITFDRYRFTENVTLDPEWSSVAGIQEEQGTKVGQRLHSSGRQLFATHPSDTYLARCDLVCAFLLNGLRALTRLAGENEGQDLLVPYAQLLDGLYRSIAPWPQVWAAHVLIKAFFALMPLLQTIMLLESYDFSFAQIEEGPRKDALRCCVSGLSAAASAVRSLDELYSLPLPDPPGRTRGEEIHHGIRQMRRLQAEDLKNSVQWKSCKNRVKTIAAMNSDVAPGSIQKAESIWSSVIRDAGKATTTLTSAFHGFLRRPSRSIADKAEAGASVMLGTLIEGLIHKPVFERDSAQAMYMKYMTELETDIWTGEPSRERLDRLRYLKFELNAFSQIQAGQLGVLNAFYDQVEPSFARDSNADWERPVPSPDYEKGAYTLHSSIMRVKKENTVIQWLDQSIPPLQEECRAQVLAMEDWRSNAAVVFAIVTVIFLPPSFVSSIYGMNTADIRDTEVRQWTYWATALPLTLIVITVTLWVVDVPPLRRFLKRWLENEVDGEATWPKRLIETRLDRYRAMRAWKDRKSEWWKPRAEQKFDGGEGVEMRSPGLGEV